MTQNSVEAGNHPHGEDSKLQVVVALHDHKLAIWYPARPREINRAFRPDHHGASFLRDVRHVQHMVDMGMRQQNKVGAFDVRINHGLVRNSHVVESERTARVPG